MTLAVNKPFSFSTGQTLSTASPSPHPPPVSSSTHHKGAESATHYPTPDIPRVPIDSSLEDDRGKSPAAEGGLEEEEMAEREGMVFHPVVRRTPQTRFDTSRDQTDMKIVSPDQVSSSGSSPVDSLSEDETPDSLNPSPSASPKKRTVKKHRKYSRDKKRGENVDIREEGALSGTSQPSSSLKTSLPHSSSSQFPRYVCDNSSSEDESYSSHPVPPCNRWQHGQKSPPTKSVGEHCHQKKARSQGSGHQGAKIVGILKKPTGGNGAGLKISEDGEGGGQGGEGERSEFGHSTAVSSRVTSALPSQTSSAAGSALTLDQAHQNGCGLVDEISQDTITLSAGTSKRVRFSDQIGGSTTPPGGHTQPAANILSSVDLWNQILPHRGYARFPPSGVYTPKMKISLSQRGWGAPRKPVQSDRITMHAPQAVENLLQAKGRQQGKREGKGGGGGGGGGGVGRGGEWVRGVEGEGEVTQDSASHESKTGRGKMSGESSAQDSAPSGNRGSGGEATQPASQSHDQKNATLATSLELTPTDEEIDGLWEQVQSQLHDRVKVSVVPQVYEFHPDPQIASTAREGERGFASAQTRQPLLSQRQQTSNGSEQRDGAGGGGGGRGEDERHSARHLPQRVQQRPLRCQGGGGHTRSAPIQLWSHSHLSESRKQTQSPSASSHPPPGSPASGTPPPAPPTDPSAPK